MSRINTKLAIVFSISVLGLLGATAANQPLEIHVFVALADNATQGIVPVPAKIGNGDDPDHNLYWGCADALPAVFGGSKDWKLTATKANPAPSVLERRTFEHRSGRLRVIADAYRGSAIQQATTDFFAALRSPQPLAVSPLAVYIGHDGLMDFSLPPAATASRGPGRGAIVLCCKSQEYFGPHLESVGAKPVLLTTQLMYPGGFLLKSALEGWLAGEKPVQIRERAAQSYANNQKLSLQAARGIFSVAAQGTATER